VIPRSQQVREILDLAGEEAERLGHQYVGAEHILLGVLRAGASLAARVLRASGVDLVAARAALRRLADQGVVPRPRPSDADLLGLLGIDRDAVRRTTAQTFGPQALDEAIREATRARRGGLGRVPRTPLRGPPMLAVQALSHAHEQAKTLGAGVIGVEVLLLGVLRDARTPRPRCMHNPWTGSCTPP